MEFKYPEAIVECDWLLNQLNNDNVRIYDCTTILHYTDDHPDKPYDVESGYELYKKSHIPGASFLNLQNDFSNNELPFIFGKPDINEFLNFKKIIDHSKFSYNEIKNLYFFPSKRWDLELRNNRIIKLSQNFTKESLELVLEFLHDNDFKDNKIVDARIKNQIILND